MIQPVSAFSPQAGFRKGPHSTKTPQNRTKSRIALANAAGTSIVAGGLTTAVARSYTSSWSHACILGVCGSMLTMFFIAPLLVENKGLLKTQRNSRVDSSVSVSRAGTVKTLKPRRFVPFGQS